MFWAVLITCCRVSLSWAVPIPCQFAMFSVRILPVALCDSVDVDKNMGWEKKLKKKKETAHHDRIFYALLGTSSIEADGRSMLRPNMTLMKKCL